LNQTTNTPKKQLVLENPEETGSPQAQINFLTQHINELSLHMTQNKRDYASQRGLLKLVARRRHLLSYLKARNPRQYQEVLQALDLRK
jgi:small subunit ribosomal protein S15